MAVLGVVAHAGEVLPVAVVGRNVVVDQEQLEQLSPYLRRARLISVPEPCVLSTCTAKAVLGPDSGAESIHSHSQTRAVRRVRRGV